MKLRVCIAVFIVIILCIGSATGVAAGTDVDSYEGQQTVMRIDNQNLYSGMDRAYNSGYFPTVQNGAANIILPLISDQTLTGNKIDVTVDLGDPSSSPFVFGNYDKTVSLGNHSVNNGTGSAKSYLVTLDLPLTGDKVNGRYPVVLNIQGQFASGESFQQSFTVFVTVADGVDPNAMPSTKPDTDTNPEPDMPTGGGGGGGEEQPKPQPKIMVASYSVTPSPVIAGQTFDLSIALQNTNDNQAIHNMKVTVAGETADVIPAGETNSFYFKKVGAKCTVDINTKMLVQQTAEPKPQKILLHIEYEGYKAAAFTADESIVIQVQQPIRIEFDTPEIPKEVNAGDTISIPLNVMNMGRGTVYNVRAEVSAPGFVPESSAFLGNLESGASKKNDLYVFVGTLDADGGNSDAKYGYTSGTVNLSYEDEFGKVSTETIDFSTNINPPIINVPEEEEEEEKPETQSQWWISVIILGGVIGGIFGVRYALKKRKQKVEDHEDI